MESYYENLVSNIKFYRNKRGFSQAKLAEECECSDGMIGQIESGKAKPSLDLLFRMAESLNIHPSDLLLRDSSKTKQEINKILKSEIINKINIIIDDLL